MKLTLLSAGDLQAALPMRDCIDAMRTAFTALAEGRAAAPPRGVVPVGDDSTTLLMGAHLPATAVQSAALATKIVSTFPGNRDRGLPTIHGVVLVLDPETGAPTALCDGTFLTAWRTGAASGLATELLARDDATAACVFGCGAQARTQVLAIDTVRSLSRIDVFARTASSVSSFIEELQPQVHATLHAAGSPAAALDGKDIVCAATTATEPIFDGVLLSTGSHINAVGSYRLDMCELDTATIRRARVFVDDREAALAESGELVAAITAGATTAAEWTPLGLVANGTMAGRTDADEITLFKSVGQAVQDVAAVSRAMPRVQELGLGRTVEL